jgi:hypothetical protein
MKKSEAIFLKTISHKSTTFVRESLAMAQKTKSPPSEVA